jgi:hypothetical protein
MSIALLTNILRIRSLKIVSLFFSFIFLISACSTVPANKQSSTFRDKRQLQETYFQQAKRLFLEQHYSQASRLFLPLARQGHRESQYVIGYMYHYGYGVPRNERESTRWIATAAARGHLKAQEALQLINATHDLAILNNHVAIQTN